MTRRMTITFICDTCGRMSQHEAMHMGFHEQIYTMDPLPADWLTVKRVGGGKISPVLDYCPSCKDKP